MWIVEDIFEIIHGPARHSHSFQHCQPFGAASSFQRLRYQLADFVSMDDARRIGLEPSIRGEVHDVCHPAEAFELRVVADCENHRRIGGVEDPARVKVDVASFMQLSAGFQRLA